MNKWDQHYFDKKTELEWDKEVAWHEGWKAGYRQGTRDMRKAYERNEVGTPRKKAKEQGREDARIPQDVEPDLTHGHERLEGSYDWKACDDPLCKKRHINVVIGYRP